MSIWSSRLPPAARQSYEKSESEIAINAVPSTSTDSGQSATLGDGTTKITTHSTGLSAVSTAASNFSTPAREIRVLKWYDRSGINKAAYSLAKAFEDDEMSKYFTHIADLKVEKRWKVHLFIMRCIIKAHVYYGEATVIGPDFDCVALWMPPGKNMDGFLPMLVSGMNRFNFWLHLSKEGRKRFFDDFLPILHDAKHDVLKTEDDNSWYLVYIGTKPESRGKGYAGDLIRYTTKKADAHGLLCYLESSKKANGAFYNKLGFRDERTIDFIRSDPIVRLWVMTRKPHARPILRGQPLQDFEIDAIDEKK